MQSGADRVCWGGWFWFCAWLTSQSTSSWLESVLWDGSRLDRTQVNSIITTQTIPLLEAVATPIAAVRHQELPLEEGVLSGSHSHRPRCSPDPNPLIIDHRHLSPLIMSTISLHSSRIPLPALLLFGRSCLLLCALLPIFVLFSDLSKILTSADQHSVQTTHFLEKEDSLPPTASSLHSGDRKMQLSTFKQTRKNASSGIYLLHELPQNSTKDCGSWNKVTCWTSKTDGTYSRWSPRTPSAYSRWVLWI